SLGSIAAELVLAVGAAMLACELFLSNRAGWLAGAVCWLLPPLAMDSCFWGQTDAWVLAPIILAIWLMVRQRWAAAGLCAAVAMLVKPQGVLIGPIALLAAMMVPGDGPGLSLRVFLRRLAKGSAAAAVGLAVITLPWTLADGAAWLRQSYFENFQTYGYTTLKAFNVWYVDALQLDGNRQFGALQTGATLAGLTKDTWGRLLVLAAMIGLGWLCWRRARNRPKVAVVIFAGLWLWSTYIWPTRVHERYVVFCMPLMVVLACGLRRYWPAVAGLVIVGAAAMTWNIWLNVPAGSANPRTSEYIYQDMQRYYSQQSASMPPSRRQPLPTKADALRLYWQNYEHARKPLRKWEILLTAVSLGAYAWAVCALAVRPLQDHCPSTPSSATPGRSPPGRQPSRPRRKMRRKGLPVHRNDSIECLWCVLTY
ncbi:MAG: DUF2029 domain-containing protein, partial [Planctomycetes bacterium]|nr:DUF2029 domain-containing protein [Planctomycetota bacterium]